MSKKINLEEIYGHFEYLSRVETDSSLIDSKGAILKAMKEACRQAIELAAENATITFEPDRGFHVCSDDGDYILDKQSILDTINQIE